MATYTESAERLVIAHEGMHIVFVQTPQGWRQTTCNTDDAPRGLVATTPQPPFQLSVLGKAWGFGQAMTSSYTNLPMEMALSDWSGDEASARFSYRHAELGLVVHVDYAFAPGAPVVRATATAVNEGDAPLVLAHLSSLCLSGVATDGLLPWNDPHKIRVHYGLQTWEGEGQWRAADLETLGVYPASMHQESTAFQVRSIGSYSTAKYIPMTVLEDLETRKTWFLQVETSSSWHYEVAPRGVHGRDLGALQLHAGGASERHIGWTKTLQPGAAFTTVPAAAGCCAGDFTDAVHALTRYRRAVLRLDPAWDGPCPVFYNDYMNGLWADPSEERSLPVIDAAAEAGVEGFCIDAGWFTPRGGSWGNGLGMWELSPDRFGARGLQGILDDIRERGMIPGLWLEFEVCGEDTPIAKEKPDAWFLCRHGRRANGGPRLFLNLCNPEVRAHLHGVIDRLVAMGVGFFKNDHNECTQLGDDTAGDSAADGLIDYTRALYSFADEVRARHPRLILENCGSGGMRQDNGIGSHFHLHSFSDQEIPYLCPSILTGQLAFILPEQLGIWATPTPLYFLDMHEPDTVRSEAYRAARADGEETIFTCVNGLCGNFYLSGRIDASDEVNRALVHEAVAVYKEERAHLHAAFPFWPLGFSRIGDASAWAAVGLANEANDRILLAVWRREGADDTVTLPLRGWAGRAARAELRYPGGEAYAVPFQYNADAGSLTVTLPKTNQARYFVIRAE